jgi:hypothetical protein
MNANKTVSGVLVEQLAENGINKDNSFVEEFNDGVVFGNPEFFAEIQRIQKGE